MRRNIEVCGCKLPLGTISVAIIICVSLLPTHADAQKLLKRDQGWWEADEATLIDYRRPHRRQESERNYNAGMNSTLSQDKSFVMLTILNDFSPICKSEGDTHAYRNRANGRRNDDDFACENLPLGTVGILIDPKLARPYLDGDRLGGNVDAAPNFVPAYAWVRDASQKEGVSVMTAWVMISDVFDDVYYSEPMSRDQAVQLGERLSALALNERATKHNSRNRERR